MKWNEKWIWWHWTIYGAVCGTLAASFGSVAGIARWSFDNGYVPWDHILIPEIIRPIPAASLKAAIIFTSLALVKNWATARTSK